MNKLGIKVIGEDILFMSGLTLVISLLIRRSPNYDVEVFLFFVGDMILCMGIASCNPLRGYLEYVSLSSILVWASYIWNPFILLTGMETNFILKFIMIAERIVVTLIILTTVCKLSDIDSDLS